MTDPSNFVIYGAYGYSGKLAARQAVALGLSPILAGRNPTRVAALADELGLRWRAFHLDSRRGSRAGLEDVSAVLNCAGPFTRTANQLVDTCMQVGVHYLDITGEIAVFEALAARDQEARDAGIMLMPGVGFDVVPSDCVAAHLKAALPSAVKLELAIHSTGRPSHGTAMTVVENLDQGGAMRIGGKIVAVRDADVVREYDFGDGPRVCVSVPWGDVSTAYHTTGIPNIMVLMALPKNIRVLSMLSRHFRNALGSSPVQWILKRQVDAAGGGPTETQRTRSRSVILGRAEDQDGNVATVTLRTTSPYTLTRDASLAITTRVCEGEAKSGFQTPAGLFGADLILSMPGTRLRGPVVRN